ncbi:putative F-box protein [Prunus yedoensis var. nudiflora]|uniref:Putative F-box protein n=1 Tax=Prunus yedoensis var. nudiflora TaxID=2094558 RepID=A0A314XKH5_PRUYE|nr:putative F-box protein [Prunus yedoensis var. nudiflora]
MRCKCVCKSWSSLFRSPSFVTDFNDFHCNDRNKSTTNFLFQKNSRLCSSKIEEQQGENNFLIPTPIAQLPLPTRSKFLEHYPDHVQYIRNPTHVAELSYLSRCEALECDSNRVQCVHGSILSFRRNRLRSRHIRFNTFTLGRDSSWRPLQVDPAHLRFFDVRVHASEIRNGRSTGCLCLNGAIHWIHGTQKIIVVFEVREETFRLVSLPEEYAREFGLDNYGANMIAFPTGVVEVGGCVGVLLTGRGDTTRQCYGF